MDTIHSVGSVASESYNNRGESSVPTSSGMTLSMSAGAATTPPNSATSGGETDLRFRRLSKQLQRRPLAHGHANRSFQEKHILLSEIQTLKERLKSFDSDSAALDHLNGHAYTSGSTAIDVYDVGASNRAAAVRASQDAAWLAIVEQTLRASGLALLYALKRSHERSLRRALNTWKKGALGQGSGLQSWGNLSSNSISRASSAEVPPFLLPIGSTFAHTISSQGSVLSSAGTAFVQPIPHRPVSTEPVATHSYPGGTDRVDTVDDVADAGDNGLEKKRNLLLSIASSIKARQTVVMPPPAAPVPREHKAEDVDANHEYTDYAADFTGVSATTKGGDAVPGGSVINFPTPVPAAASRPAANSSSGSRSEHRGGISSERVASRRRNTGGVHATTASSRNKSSSSPPRLDRRSAVVSSADNLNTTMSSRDSSLHPDVPLRSVSSPPAARRPAELNRSYSSSRPRSGSSGPTRPITTMAPPRPKPVQLASYMLPTFSSYTKLQHDGQPLVAVVANSLYYRSPGSTGSSSPEIRGFRNETANSLSRRRAKSLSPTRSRMDKRASSSNSNSSSSSSSNNIAHDRMKSGAAVNSRSPLRIRSERISGIGAIDRNGGHYSDGGRDGDGVSSRYQSRESIGGREHMYNRSVGVDHDVKRQLLFGSREFRGTNGGGTSSRGGESDLISVTLPPRPPAANTAQSGDGSTHVLLSLSRHASPNRGAGQAASGSPDSNAIGGSVHHAGGRVSRASARTVSATSAGSVNSFAAGAEGGRRGVILIPQGYSRTSLEDENISDTCSVASNPQPNDQGSEAAVVASAHASASVGANRTMPRLSRENLANRSIADIVASIKARKNQPGQSNRHSTPVAGASGVSGSSHSNSNNAGTANFDAFKTRPLHLSTGNGHLVGDPDGNESVVSASSTATCPSATSSISNHTSTVSSFSLAEGGAPSSLAIVRAQKAMSIIHSLAALGDELTKAQ